FLEITCDFASGIDSSPCGLIHPSAEPFNPFAPPALPGFLATMGWSVPGPRFGTFGLGGLPLGPFPLASCPRFPRSTPEPEPSSRRLYAGHHRGRRQASPRLRPRLTTAPGFGDVPTLSTPHRRFTCVRLLGSHLTSSRPAFSGTLTTGTFTPCSFR